MSKLDEIQERIDMLPTRMIVSPSEIRILDMLTDIVSELKRINAERKAMDKVLVDLAAKDNE